MGFFDRLFGNQENTTKREPVGSAQASPDQLALERYRYMVKTAPPETLEQAHTEAFARLTPEQRRQILGELAQAAPPGERAAVEAVSSEDPKAMAQVATRTEVRQPGFMERTLGGGGMGFGASLLSSFAMGFVGSMVAQSFFSAMGGFGDDAGAHGDTAANDDSGNDAGSGDEGYDDGGFDDGGGGDFEI